MSGLMLIRPMWLWALLPLAALALWSWRARGAGGWERVVDPALMPVLRRLGLIGEAGGRGIRLLPFAAAAFLVLGLAGPGLPRAGEAEDCTLTSPSPWPPSQARHAWQQPACPS